MTKYRIRLSNGRVIGPFLRHQLFELKAKGHIKGIEEGQIFPTGDWAALSTFDFYGPLMDDNKTTFFDPKSGEDTFLIDLTSFRLQQREKEIAALPSNEVSLQELTETIRIPVEPVPRDIEPVPLTADNQLHEDYSDGKTVLNTVAQRELEFMRKREREEEDRRRFQDEVERSELEEAEKANYALEVAQKNEVVPDDSTQLISLDEIAQSDLMVMAQKQENDQDLEIDLDAKSKRQEENRAQNEEENQEREVELKKKKKKKIIMVVVAALLAYAILFPADDKPTQPEYKHVVPQIVFPIPFDKADSLKSEAEFNRGKQLFSSGSYPNIVKAGIHFKNSYENNLENLQALHMMVRAYGEQIRFSKNIEVDSQTLFNILINNRPHLLRDHNGVIGLNLFYMSIGKLDAANDVIARYLKLDDNRYREELENFRKSNNKGAEPRRSLTEDLFATYIKSLLKRGKLDVANQFYQGLAKAPSKNHYVYDAMIEYLLINQEFDKAEELVDEAVKRDPQLVKFHLLKAELALRKSPINLQLVQTQLERASQLNHEQNDFYKAQFLQHAGLLSAAKGDVKRATFLLTSSLKLEDSSELRMKLADLSNKISSEKETTNLINESKAHKFLQEAKRFFSNKNYDLALSTAIRAHEIYPNYIPSGLFLAKVQLRIGLTGIALKTLEQLTQKYPENKEVNFALVNAYIETYKFNDAKNRVAIISTSDMKDSPEYASLNAKLYTRIGDALQAISWLKASVAMNPLNDHDLFRLSEIMLKRSNFDGARMLLNKCIDLDPINADYRIAYSKLIYETQDDQAAVGYLLGLLEQFGENARFLSEIAIFYFRAGKVKDFTTYKEKIENLPTKDKALYEFLIRTALIDERYEEIPGLVEKLLEIEPGDLESMMTAGKVLFETGKLVEAAKWFRRVMDKLSTYPRVQYYTARIKFLNGDPDGALEEIKKNIKDNGETDEDLVFMAEIFVFKGEFLEAENLYKRAQKINRNSYEAIVGLADLSTKRNNFDLALDLYKRALKRKGGDPIIHRKVGDVYRLLGQGTLAIESYKMYLEMDPEAKDKAQIESYIQLMQ